MHHALQIQEILFNILGHCYPANTKRKASNLAALARTCRAFKDPALDMLWEELDDLSALARCLPKACRLSSPVNEQYAFTRSLSKREWDVLRSYACRIRFIQSFNGLTPESIETLAKPSPTEPLFPSLLHVRLEYTLKAIPLMCLPLPSLISLDVMYPDPLLFPRSLSSISELSPNLRRLSISVHSLEVVDAGHLFHLSRLTALSRLEFVLSFTLADQLAPSGPPLLFPNLRKLTLCSGSLDSISRLVSRTQLPAITDFTAHIRSCPSKKDVSSFFAGLQASVIGRTIQKLRLSQRFPFNSVGVHATQDDRLVLSLEDLQPCMAFNCLRRMTCNIEWKVTLTDGDVLMLMAAWPQLEQFCMNEDWGWGTLGGVTPSGLLRILQICPSLTRIAVTIDLRGFTQLPPLPEGLKSTLPRMSHVDVLDSFIEDDSVPAISAFIAGIGSRPSFLFRAWDRWAMDASPNRDICTLRWNHVRLHVEDIVRQRSGRRIMY